MIKWITIIFLLMNVGYFGWQMNQQISHATVSDTAKEQPTLASEEPLVLLSELEKLPTLRDESILVEDEFVDEVNDDNVSTDSEESVAFNSQLACFSIGPYPNKQGYQSLKQILNERQMPYHERSVETRSRERYWVYLEPQATEAEAKRRLQELQKQGLKDYYLINKGDKKNAISLGLFSSQDSVNRRLAELEKKGYYPVVVPQHKITAVYWLDLQISEDLKLPSLPTGVKITDINCQEIALRDLDQ